MKRDQLIPKSNLTSQEIGELAYNLIDREVLIKQSSLVELCFENQLFDWDDVENLYADNEEGESEAQDIYMWILVEQWLANKLRKHGEPVLDNDYGTWWGRTCCGQQYSVDSVIKDIAMEIHNG